MGPASVSSKKIDQHSPARRRLVGGSSCATPPSPPWNSSFTPSRSRPLSSCASPRRARRRRTRRRRRSISSSRRTTIRHCVRQVFGRDGHYNNLVVNKNTALAVTVSAYESFHPVKDEVATLYNRDVKRSSLSTGRPARHAGLRLVRLPGERICAKKVKDDFDVFVDADTCAAKSVGKDMCKANTDAKPRVTVDPEEVLADERRGGRRRGVRDSNARPSRCEASRRGRTTRRRDDDEDAIASANADATALCTHTHTRSSIPLADAGDDCSTRCGGSSHPLRHRDDSSRECAGPHHPPVASHGAPGGQVPEGGRC